MTQLGEVELIARTCHEVNRAYCAALGDGSQPPWEEAPEWQKDSAVAGVCLALNSPELTSEESHRSWCEVKWAAGWTYGPVKDTEAKTHPCLVSYEELDLSQRVKDDLFLAVVQSLSHLVRA
jgi:hypothetical protein